MLDILVDLVRDLFAGGKGDDASRRVRRMRRKLVRYVKNAPPSAFLGSQAPHVDSREEILPEARARAVKIAKTCAIENALDWGDVSARYFDALEEQAPGLLVQLPPDEPRMVYAGSKSL